MSASPNLPPDSRDRLDSWKEIAAYLGRTERTVRRWEDSLGLPVHRLANEKRNSVYGYRAELDAWRMSRAPGIGKGEASSAPPEAPGAQPPSGRRGRWPLVLWTAAAVLAAGLGIWFTARPRPQRLSISSIAVLPFDNLSHDQSQEWFSDGLTETLITELSKVRSLKVISRTSVMQYKGRSKPLKQIGSELGVDAVVEGSALRVGDRVRITAQLISASTDAHLWGRDFDRDIHDVLDLQKEVAGSIAQQVGATILPGKARPVNPEAMAAYLKGLYQFNRGELGQAMDLAREAVRLDPEMARAHELLALALLTAADFAQTRYGAIVPEVRSSVRRALDLDPDRRSPLSALGWSYFAHEHDWVQAEKYMREGVDESEPITGANYAWVLAGQGRHEEAIRVVEQALTHDPANPFILTEVGRRYDDARRYDEAARYYRKALELSPADGYPASHLVFALLMASREKEAFDAYLQTRRDPDSAGIDWRGIYRSGGWPAVLRVRLDHFPKNTYTQFKVWFLILSGRRNDALNELEILEKSDSSGAMLDLEYGIYDPLRQEPRFQSLMKRVGYPESMWRSRF